MEDFLDSCVTRYVDLATDIQGTAPKLRVVATPFIEDSPGGSPSGSSCAPAGTPGVFCPWCNNHFPIAGNQSDKIAALRDAERKKQLQKAKEKKKTEDDGDTDAMQSREVDEPKSATSYLQPEASDELENADRGVLQPLAARVLMKILYAARMARFDLLRAVCNLACFVTRWTLECDKKLHRLICYIAATKHHRQIGWIGDNTSELAPHLYADADFASCKITQRSTGGGHLAIMGPNSCFPQAAKSARHGAISSSTPEAEMYTGHIIMKNVGIPAKDLWTVLLREDVPLYFHEDNQAMIQIVKSGRNPTMRHLGRVHRIAVAWLHERWLAGDFTLFYEKSKRQYET